MIIKVDGPHVLGGGVDEAEEMLLAGLDLPQSVLTTAEVGEGVVAVKHVVPCAARSEVGDARVGLGSSHGLGAVAKEIVDHDSAHIDIVVGSSGAVDDHGTADTITILRKSVGMVPARSVLLGQERVCAGITRSESTLGNAWNTVLVIGLSLSDAVPVDGGGVVLQLVRDSDLDSVTPVAFNQRSWDLAVDSECKTLDTIKIDSGVGDDPIIGTDLASLGAVMINIGVNAVAAAPFRSITSSVAATVLERLEWLGDVGGISARSRSSAIGSAAT